ncbi:MAG TPA: MFS transporter [Bacteriovoracaceae bacterium]|nr:MFS transporter [Bacteriovoracaceae bacterium]
MLTKLKKEFSFFNSQSENFRTLFLTNLVYAFVLPVIDIFVAAYIMRNSNDPVKVIIYQLTIYTGIPLTFLVNGFLLKHFQIKKLYSAGMLLSGISMAIMMSLKTLDLVGIAAAGLTMGLSFGFYWANRDYLSLANTDDTNRNYYYGLETFAYTVVAVIVPIGIGWFIEGHDGGNNVQGAYQIITGLVFLITVFASFVCLRGSFADPEQKPFVFFKFHPLWQRFLFLASLKGLVQGFLVTAPAMLVMMLLGKEGALGTAQSVGAIIAAIAMYVIGRYSRPEHRLQIFTVGLILFTFAALSNGIFYNEMGVVLFMLFLLVARPLMDLAYFPIQYNVINVLVKKEQRSEYAYILNHEAGLYLGRLMGAGTFLALAYLVSTEVALRYAILIVAVLQLSSIWVARKIIVDCAVMSKVLVVAFIMTLSTASMATEQKAVHTIDQMSFSPQPFKIIDYHKLAQDFDKTMFETNHTGQYWPLVWIDRTRNNFSQDVVGMYTTIGDIRQGPNMNGGTFHEALANMGAVLGATLVGIDKSQGQYNYVGMLKNYFNRENGWNIMMNNTNPEAGAQGGGYGRDWWYDIFPNVLFYAIYDKYPKEADFDWMAKSIAEKFYKADKILNGNYSHSFFDYQKMQPQKSLICAQPDVAAGHSWVLYSAYKRFKDIRYLEGAISSLKALDNNTENPSYEVLMPFGALMAARLNAEQGTQFDVGKMLDWTFNGEVKCRKGWGVLVKKWNGFDVSGLMGSTVDHGGYGFLMNTYDMAWPLLPLVRYDQSYARAIGKWMLNAANAAKLTYPAHIPARHQTLSHIAHLTKGVIAYEGIAKKSVHKEYAHLKAPVAQGDGPNWLAGNPAVTQFSVYGSAHVGIFGSIISRTNIPEILRLNLIATDFFRDEAYPTYLYFNPLETTEMLQVTIDGQGPVDIYNSVKGQFVARAVSGSVILPIKTHEAAVLVMVPASGKLKQHGQKLFVNGVVIDYRKEKHEI